MIHTIYPNFIFWWFEFTGYELIVSLEGSGWWYFSLRLEMPSTSVGWDLKTSQT